MSKLDTEMAAGASESADVTGDDFLSSFVGALESNVADAPDGDTPEVAVNEERDAEEGAPADEAVEVVEGGSIVDQLFGGDPVKELKKAEQTGDALVDDVPDVPAGKTTEHGITTWKTMKGELRELRGATRDMTRELEELRAKAAELETVKRKVERVDEMEREFYLTKIESSSAYREAVVEPMQAIGAAAAALADEKGLDAEEIFAALGEPDEKLREEALTEALSFADDATRVKFWRMADDAAGVMAKARDLKERSREAVQELETKQREEKDEREKGRKQAYEKAVKATATALESRFKTLELGETLTKIREDALAIDFETVTEETRSYSVLAGLLLPAVYAKLTESAGRAAAAEARVAAMSSSSPGGQALGAPKEGASTAKSFLDGIMEELKI